jgi:hypothetical protein
MIAIMGELLAVGLGTLFVINFIIDALRLKDNAERARRLRQEPPIVERRMDHLLYAHSLSILAQATSVRLALEALEAQMRRSS